MANDAYGKHDSGDPLDSAKFSAPRFILEVEDQIIPVGVSQFVEQVIYESAEGAVDMMKVSLNDPEKTISKLKLFLPGNELSLKIGYGPSASNLVHIGRAVIVNVRPTFPLGELPSLEVTAYTKDHFMMDVRPDPDPPPNSRPKSGKPREKKINWTDTPVELIVGAIGAGHGLTADVDPVDLPKGRVYQPLKMSNYDFIKGLANITGFYFWVDCDENGEWFLHFKDPEKYVAEQKKMYTFKYAMGNESTLLTFDPEMVFKGHYTKIQAQTKTASGKVLKSTKVEETEHEWSTKPIDPTEEAEGEIGTAQEITLFIGEYSFKAIHKGEIQDEATLDKWLEQWWKRHREDFVIGSGQVVGLESLRARQIHRLVGLVDLYDGEWLFTNVRQIFDTGPGYTCEIVGRKLV